MKVKYVWWLTQTEICSMIHNSIPPHVFFVWMLGHPHCMVYAESCDLFGYYCLEYQDGISIDR